MKKFDTLLFGFTLVLLPIVLRRLCDSGNGAGDVNIDVKDISAHKYLKCKKPVHVFCGIESEEEEGYGQSVLCFKCDTKGKMDYSILYVIIHFCELILNDINML